MTTAEKRLNMHVAVMDTILKLANAHFLSTAQPSMRGPCQQGQNPMSFDGLKGDNGQSGWSIGDNDKAAISRDIPIVPVAFPKGPWASRERFVPPLLGPKTLYQ